MIGKLILYELKKISSSSFIKILAALLLILNIVLCAYSSYTPVSDEDEYIDTVYEIYTADPSLFFSEYKRIKEEYDSLDFSGIPSSAYSDGKYFDIALFDHVYQIVTADKNYHSQLDKVLGQAKSICNNYEVSGMTDSYVYRYHRYVIERYTCLYDNVKLDNAPVNGWSQYFGYNADFFIVFILIAVICVNIVLTDRSCGFYTISSICDNGRTKSAIAKIVTAIIMTSAVVLLFTASSFITAGISSRGYSDLHNAAQAIESLRLLPLKLSFGGALAVDCMLKLVSAIVYCMVLFFIAVAIKHTVISIGAGIGILILNYAISGLDEVKFRQWKFLNLWSTYYIEEYAPRYRSIELYNYSIGLTVVFAAAAFCLILGACVLSCVVYPKKSSHFVTGCPRIITRIKDKLLLKTAAIKDKVSAHGSMSLVFYELYKQRVVYAVLVILIIIKSVVTSDYYRPQSSIYDDALKEYIAEIGGAYTEEKAAYIAKEYSDCEYIINQFENIRLEWWRGEISSELYNRLFSEYMGAMTKMDALNFLRDRSDYLRALYDERNIVGSYIYDYGYHKYVSQGVDWVLLLFASILCCRSYLYEHTGSSSGASMLTIGNSAENGRKTLFLYKAAVCVMSSACAWFICKMLDLYYLFRSYNMPDMSAPILSMPRYDGTLFNLTISEYIVIINFLSLIGTILIASICFCIGILIKRAIAAYAITTAVLAVPFLALNTGVSASGYFDLTMLYDTDRLYRLSPTPLAAPVYGICFTAVILCVTFITIIYLMRKSERGNLG